MMQDFKDDELINVRMTREDYEVVKDIIRREKAYNWFIASLKGHWIFVVAGLALILISFSEKLGITIGTGAP